MQYNPPTAPWRPKVGDTVSMETPVLPRDGDERPCHGGGSLFRARITAPGVPLSIGVIVSVGREAT